MATVQKRGETYRIRCSLGYDTNGKQVIKSMTYKPEQGLTKRQIHKELEQVKANFERQCETGEIADGGKIKLSEFCPQYLDLMADKLSPTALSMYKRVIRQNILPVLGHFRLQKIKPLHIQQFVQTLDKQGNYKSSTVRRYYVVLESIMHTAYRLGLIRDNPTSGGRIELPKLEEEETEILTKEEIQQILSCLEKEPLMWQCLITLAITTGCRRGELIALEWKDIDFEKATISITKSAYTLKGQGTHIKEPKTRSSIRKIVIPDFMVLLLQQYRKEQMQIKKNIGDRWQGADWVFTQWDGKILYPTTPTQWFSKFQKRHNLPHKKFHALRHSSATLLLMSGVNIKEVGSRLGHSQLSTTNRYVHAIKEADRAAANDFQKLFAGSGNKDQGKDQRVQ